MWHRGMVAGLLCVVLFASAMPEPLAAQPSEQAEPAPEVEPEEATGDTDGDEGAVEPGAQPQPSDAPAAQAVQAVQDAADAEAEQEPRPGEELIGLRTEASKTFATDTPGTLTTRVYGDPVHFEVDEGVWEEIDEALVPAAKGRWRNGANSFGVSLASTSGDGLLAELDLGQGRRLGFAMDGRSRLGVVDPQSGGAAVIYREVLSHVDVRLTSTATGLKEELVLRSPAAADTFEFPLRLEGVSAQLDPGTGEVVYRDDSGEVVAAVPRGWMEDSASGTQGVGAVSDAVAYELVERDGTKVLRVRVDRSWLDDPARVFPVVVDPTYTTSPHIYSDTYVREGSTADFSGLATLRTGRNGFSTNRTFMQFGVGDRGGLIPMDGYHTVNWAQIHLYNFSSAACSPALSSRYVHIKRVTSWWLHQNPVWPGPAYDNYSWASSDKALGASSSCPAGWVTFGVTGLARAWNDNVYPNYGVTVVASASFTDTYRAYYSQESSNTAVRPYMAVNWTNAAPATPTPQQPANGAVLTATRPRLTASFSDPDGDWGWNRFTLQRQDGASWITVIDDTRGPVTECCQGHIDPPTLQEGVYRWRVRSDDAYNLSAWSPYVTFTVDPTAPAAPTVASSTHPSQSSWYASDAPTLSWTAADTSGINGYSWVRDQSPTTTPNTSSQGTATSTSYSNLPEGVNWFHVRARNGAGLWGPAAHYKIQIDKTAPAAPAVTSPTHPSQEESYTDKNPSFSWSASDTSGINGYSWVRDQAPTTTPNTTSQGTATSTSYTNLPEGEHYFHVRARNGAGLWGPAAHYRVHIVPDCPGFISKWSPRLYDVEFVDDLRAQDGYPQYILDEGYHALPEPVQRALIDCLFAALQDQDPFPPELSQDDIDHIREDIFRLIFRKETLGPEAIEDIGAPVPNDGHSESPLPAEVLEALTNPPALAMPELPATPPLPLPTLLADIADPNALLEAQGLLGNLGVPIDVGGDLERLTTAVPLGPVVDSAVDVIQDAALLDVPGLSTVTDPLGTLLDATTYRLCWASPTSTGCSPTSVLGLPVALDVTGDGTLDVSGTLSPALGALFPMGASVTYTLDRLSTSETAAGALQAHVWATYDIVASDTRMRVGFDGWSRGETLSDATRLTFTANSLTELLAGRLDADYQLAHSGTIGASWALSAARTSVALIGGEIDPSAVSVRFTGVPQTVAGEVVASQPDSDGQRHVAFSATASSQPQVVDAVFQRDRDTSRERDQARLVVHEPPTSVAATYTRADSAEGSRGDIDYTANAPAGRLQGTWVHRPDSDQDDTYSSSFADLRDAPATAAASVHQHESVTTVSAEGAAAWGPTRVGRSDVVDGQRVHSAAVATDSMPEAVDLAFDTSDGDLRAGYTASAGIGSLHAAVVNRRGVPLTLLAHATGLPASVTLAADPAQTSLTLNATAPISGLTVRAAVADGAVPARGDGDAVAVHTDGGAIGLNTHLSGVQTLHGGLASDRADITGRFSPGGQPLTVALLDVGELLAVGAVSALPAEVDLSVSTGPVQPQVAYEASAPVPLVQAYLSDLTDGHTVLAAAEDVPAAVTATATIGDPLHVAYTATAPTGQVSFAYSPDHITHLDPETDQRYALAVADALPAQAALRVATDDGFALDWTADAAIGHLGAAVRGLGPMAATDARLVASATDVPATLSATLDSATRTLAFQAPNAPVGDLYVAARNHPGERLPGPHLKAIVDQPGGTYDLSGHLTGLRAATVTAGPDQSLSLDLHADLAGAPLTLLGDVTLEADRVIRATGVLDNFPTDLTVRYDLNDQILYDAGSTNMTVVMAGEAGWQAALDTIPALPLYNGVAVRDGACQPGITGCGPSDQATACTDGLCRAVKVTLAAAGLPHHVAITPASRRVEVRGYHPDPDGKPLVAYADIDHLAARAFEAQAALTVPAGPLDVTIDGLDVVKTGADGDEAVRLGGSLTANGPVGAVTIYGTVFGAHQGADVTGEVRAVNVGRHAAFDATIGDETSITVESDAAASTGVAIRGRTTRDGQPAAAEVVLSDLPGTAHLTFASANRADQHEGAECPEPNSGQPASDQAPDLPLLAYTADADTLDGRIVISTRFAARCSDVVLDGLAAAFTNLGRNVTTEFVRGTDEGEISSLQYLSSPATDRLAVAGGVTYAYEQKFGPYPWFIPVPNHPLIGVSNVNIDMQVDVGRLMLGATDVEELSLDWQVMPFLGIRGTYGQVQLRTEAVDLDVRELRPSTTIWVHPFYRWRLIDEAGPNFAGSFDRMLLRAMRQSPTPRARLRLGPICRELATAPHAVTEAWSGDTLVLPGGGEPYVLWPNVPNSKGEALIPRLAGDLIMATPLLNPYFDEGAHGFSAQSCDS